ncbi:hypothetical protein F4703DRAFT_1787960 [Phycomyces blakesleeanus]|uniref:Actin-like ATPase domain-containing protein n=1 Tax=Phycomyces blakesleeanus (strain ATCC 8743b / DSM 1359 / FGSC 10004 / NBRC 33097 / NRRL 1555) TaxID=763407 RepID=A0A167MSE7_PHYB8|nr:hypothetical protein PHYBLDRAFT_64743 [Phycomyces blakesleeanus NRRL 1555(-)]OAD73784.1 hypothetical protein PHYBLDRAFT_64743 [Phycomyces blakesleeanus NRRL 1555(-)]|eukprot:XP_018291824.1 hypothetical protein PHYBLDRAFT_64743 [Phycomyces blakesleeanus NRRL 1555(-)]
MAGRILDNEFDNYSYIVGIDFGTTFSGCSYIYIKSSINEIFDITDWPKRSGYIYPKVPTVLFYEQNSKNLIAWGYDAIQRAKRPDTMGVLIDKFKLHLDHSQTYPALPNGLTVLEVITDYLREFNLYIHTCLKDKLGVIYNSSNFKYCLTVPAIWDDQAKAIMREAAVLAGIVDRSDNPDRLILTSEPEAASLYCEKKSGQFNLKHGQRFMICDAGGGTLDLIVFEIDTSSGDASLREVTKGSGSTCGSTFLDRNMRDLIIKRFGTYADGNKEIIDNLIDHFVASTKPQFDDEDDEFFTIPISLGLNEEILANIGVADGRLQVTVDELREDVFEPVVKQVLDLISDQINQSRTQIDAIFLVGGFGQSRYLGRRVKEIFKPKVGSIYVPSRGEMAVVRGAVMFGMDPNKVTHRILRRTYGLRCGSIFDALRDPPEKKYIDYDGVTRCHDRFSIFATKGESMAVNKCVSNEYFVFYPGPFNSDLFAYDFDGSSPRYTTDLGVRKVAKFSKELSIFTNVKLGDKIFFTTNMYFGKTEIMIETLIRGEKFTYTSSFASHELEKTSS